MNHSSVETVKNIGLDYKNLKASLIAQLVKNLPAMQEILVRFLGWEAPLEKRNTPGLWPGEFHGLCSP